jgi:uncharacterized protein (TIGR03067 family)
MAVGSLSLVTAAEPKEASDKAKSPPKELTSDSGTEDAKTELDNMQGTWTVVAAEREGKKAPDEAIKAMSVVIKGDSLILRDGNHQEKGTLKVDPSVKPKSLDLMPAGENQKVSRGIYELTISTLRMCWTKEGGERPREFATKPASNMGMFVLKRDKK